MPSADTIRQPLYYANNGSHGFTHGPIGPDGSHRRGASNRAGRCRLPAKRYQDRLLPGALQNTRALLVDPVVVREAWLAAYDQITSHAKAALDDYARQADPFGKVGHRAVTTEVMSVVRASDKSFRIAWIEHAYADGAPMPPQRWSAILTIITQTPRTEERLRKNPLGIYVDAIAWSRELGDNG